MRKSHRFLRSFIYALILCSCSIEINQTVEMTPTLSVEVTQDTSSTSALPTTHIPVSWAHLNLTGKLIYLNSTMDGGIIIGNIQILDLRTGDISTVFSAPRAWMYYATVSPDSKTLVMSYAPPLQSNSPSARILYVMPLDGTTEPRPLLTPPMPDDRYIQVEWSPDGKYIYFVHYNQDRMEGRLDPTYDISRIKYPNGQPEKIADSAFWPRLSFDSTKVVYISFDPTSKRHDLFVANADGSNPQQVNFSGSWTAEIMDAPIFSPDGNFILLSVPSLTQSYQPNWLERFIGIQVARAHDVPSDWWSVPITGGVPTRLTNIQTTNLFASISPDKKHIASVSGEGIFVMDLDGSNLTQLISDSGVHGTVSWIP